MKNKLLVCSLLLAGIQAMNKLPAQQYCVASFTWAASGASVTFTNTSVNMGTPTYSWYFGGGGSSALANPVHVFSGPTPYYAVLSFSDAGFGCWDSASAYIDPATTAILENAAAIGTIENFPNPFNVSTTIRYSIIESGNVEINVYNVLSEKMAVLVNEKKSAGDYKIPFNAGNLSAGIYLLELKVNNQSTLKRLNISR